MKHHLRPWRIVFSTVVACALFLIVLPAIGVAKSEKLPDQVSIWFYLKLLVPLGSILLFNGLMVAIDAVVVQKRLAPGWKRSLDLSIVANVGPLMAAFIGLLVVNGMVSYMDKPTIGLEDIVLFFLFWCLPSIPLEFVAAKIMLASLKKYSTEEIWRTMLVANGVTAAVAAVVVGAGAACGIL